jgi:hypothetical protein
MVSRHWRRPKENGMNDDELMRRARKRVGMKMGFYIHLLVYVLVNSGLLLLNLGTGGARWHLAPLLGWGLGLAIHGLVTWMALSGEGMRDRMVADEARRLRERG